MAHEVETMAYFGETPWHNLGTKVEHLMTSAEALIAAGLDWLVEKSPIFNQEGKQITNCFEIRRVKDHEHYCVITDEYNPYQNTDSFKFFDELVMSKDAIYETAGSLRKGAVIWILAKLNDMIYIKDDPNEAIAKYVLLKNSHNTEMALQVVATPIRVVCMNTLRQAIARSRNGFYAKHTGDITARVGEARETLSLINKQYDYFKIGADIMANKQVSESIIRQTLYSAFKQDIAMPMETIYKPTQREMVCVRSLFEGKGKGLNNTSIKGSRYALYNAVAEHVDFRDYRQMSGEKRLNNVWFGTGSDIKNRAYDFLDKCPDMKEGSDDLVRAITKVKSAPEPELALPYTGS